MATTNADSGQAPDDASTSGQEPNTTSSSSQADKTQQDYDKIIADLRRENAAARVKAKELDDLKQKLETDKLTETEKLTKQIADLQKAHDDAVKQAQTLKLNAAISSQAARLGFANPDLAAKLLDASQIADDGSNVESLLKDLLKSEPYLAGTQRASSGGATNPSRSAANANQGITEEFVQQLVSGQLGPDAYNKLTPAQRAQVTEITSRRRF
jgi:hypothetical protein